MSEVQVQVISKSVKHRLQSHMSIATVADAVQELVYNSLDAKSTAITIRLNLPKYRIQVVDNGEGISKSNMTSIGNRHVTNKCKPIENLNEIKTYGYRGQFLANLCEMCKKIEIVSKYENSKESYVKLFQNGKWKLPTLAKNRPSSGTTVTLTDFAYNLPVKQKRIDKTVDIGETKKVIETLAIIHAHVSFSLRDDISLKLVFQKSKSDSVAKSLKCIYPNINENELGAIKVQKNKITVSGLIYKKPLANTKLHFIYINKIPIKKSPIFKAINEILDKSTIKHPLYVFNIKCDRLPFDILKQSECSTNPTIIKCVQKAVNAFLKRENLISDTTSNGNVGKPAIPPSFGVSQIKGAVRGRTAKRKIISDNDPVKEKQAKYTHASNHQERTNHLNLEIEESDRIRKFQEIEIPAQQSKEMASKKTADKQIYNLTNCSENKQSKGKSNFKTKSKMKNLSTKKTKEPLLPRMKNYKIIAALNKPNKSKIKQQSSRLENKIYNENSPNTNNKFVKSNTKAIQLKDKYEITEEIFNDEKDTADQAFSMLNLLKDNPKNKEVQHNINNIKSTQHILANGENEENKLDSRSNIFEKHKHTQSLILSSESSEETYCNLNDEEKGREWIMNKFLNSCPNATKQRSVAAATVSVKIIKQVIHNERNGSKDYGKKSLASKCVQTTFFRIDPSTKSKNWKMFETTAVEKQQFKVTFNQNSVFPHSNLQRNPFENERAQCISRKKMTVYSSFKIKKQCIPQVGKLKTKYWKGHQVAYVGRSEITTKKCTRKKQWRCPMPNSPLFQGESKHHLQLKRTIETNRTRGAFRAFKTFPQLFSKDRLPVSTKKISNWEIHTKNENRHHVYHPKVIRDNWKDDNVFQKRKNDWMDDARNDFLTNYQHYGRNNGQPICEYENFNLPKDNNYELEPFHVENGKMNFPLNNLNSSSDNKSDMFCFQETVHLKPNDKFKIAFPSMNAKSRCSDKDNNNREKIKKEVFKFPRCIRTDEKLLEGKNPTKNYATLGFSRLNMNRPRMQLPSLLQSRKYIDNNKETHTHKNHRETKQKNFQKKDRYAATSENNIESKKCKHFKIKNCFSNVHRVSSKTSDNTTNSKFRTTDKECNNFRCISDLDVIEDTFFETNSGTKANEIGSNANKSISYTNKPINNETKVNAFEKDFLRVEEEQELTENRKFDHPTFTKLFGDNTEERVQDKCNNNTNYFFSHEASIANKNQEINQDFPIILQSDNKNTESLQYGFPDTVLSNSKPMGEHENKKITLHKSKKLTQKSIRREQKQDEQNNQPMLEIDGNEKPNNHTTFNMKKRIDFIPKGSSVIMKSQHINSSLTPNSKKKLYDAILESHECELSLVKWKDFSDKNDMENFFKKLYSDKAKQFEPLISKSDHRLVAKLFNKGHEERLSKDIFDQIEILGQLDDKFIVTWLTENNLIILFDQHGVHERIRLETLLEEYTKTIEEERHLKVIGCPELLIMEFNDNDMDILRSYKKKFEGLGLFYVYNNNTVKVIDIPLCVYNQLQKLVNKTEQNSLYSTIKCIIDEQIEALKHTKGAKIQFPPIIHKIINSEACRGAIKFGTKLTIEECTSYLQKLKVCKLPFQCAHGRPTFAVVLHLNHSYSNNHVEQPNLKRLRSL